MARILILSFVALLVLCGLAFGGLFWGFKHQIARPGPHAAEAVVLIPPGSGINQISDILVKRGVLRSDLLFRLAARMENLDRVLKPGELAFPARASLLGVLDVLRRGEPVARYLTLAEGLSVSEIMALIDQAEGLQGPLPEAPAEGSLLPETYRYAYFDTKADMVRRLERAMTNAVAKAWADRAPDLPISDPGEAVILASIVEKETGVAEERPRVAAVFVNRLRRGMRLQSDPTVIYGITQGKAPLGRALTRKDLDAATPFNTYAIPALPPTPIANPGLASIRAVLDPAETRELYFVADGTGGHAFAETLAQHNRNVAKWRKIEKRLRKERGR